MNVTYCNSFVFYWLQFCNFYIHQLLNRCLTVRFSDSNSLDIITNLWMLAQCLQQVSYMLNELKPVIDGVIGGGASFAVTEGNVFFQCWCSAKFSDSFTVYCF